MPNLLFQRYLRVAIIGAIQKHEAAVEIDHMGLRGHVREIFVKELLEPVLPVDADTVRGKITDSSGQLSPECDIIVYGKNILPPLLFDKNTGVIPVEACLFAIEVKSKLTAPELRDSIEKFKKLRQLVPEDGKSVPVPILFAFETDLSEHGKSELDRYFEQDSLCKHSPYIGIICVVGRGHWFFNFVSNDMYWGLTPADKLHAEVLTFLGMFVNSVRPFLDSRARNSYGAYILEQASATKVWIA